ncbi:MAG: nickel pincer cofactor biosynthesis protein LarC [Myxococcota bacterium]
MTDLLFIDASISGLAGDMFVAACLDLGLDWGLAEDALAPLGLEFQAEISRVSRSGIDAAHFKVIPGDAQPARDWSTIRTLLQRLPTGPRERALATFERLAGAEATVHGVAVDKVHFHEVGAVDSIVDIVAACTFLDHLGGTVVSSPLPLGHGTIQSAHGVLPLPAPATVACLEGAPTVSGNANCELVTPTGAALVRTAATRFEAWPSFRPKKTGWGAGTRELPDRPNVVRLVTGAASQATDTIHLLEANLDDLSPEIAAHAMSEAFAAGAVDVWLSPITMKKGRLGTLFAALVPDAAKDSVARAILRETSSLGLRHRRIERVVRPRRSVTVTTRFGELPIKIADGDGLPRNVAPELEPCRAAAKAHDVPLKEVFAAALAAAEALP